MQFCGLFSEKMKGAKRKKESDVAIRSEPAPHTEGGVTEWGNESASSPARKTGVWGKPAPRLRNDCRKDIATAQKTGANRVGISRTPDQRGLFLA